MKQIYENYVDKNNNRVIGRLELEDSSFDFKGKNNVIYCNGTIQLEKSRLRFTASNSVIYFDINPHPFSLNSRLGNDSVLYIGKNCYFNKTSNLYATERKNIIIGRECLLSYDCWFRTSDPHLLYDVQSKKRINYGKSILVGDHVWIGQNCLILKNTLIGSGAVIGCCSVVTGKKIESNTIYAGNPAKKVKTGVFYPYPQSAHDFTEEDIVSSESYNSDEYIFEKDVSTLDLSKIDKDLLNLNNVEDKIDYIKTHLSHNDSKNRFFVA